MAKTEKDAANERLVSAAIALADAQHEFNAALTHFQVVHIPPSSPSPVDNPSSSLPRQPLSLIGGRTGAAGVSTVSRRPVAPDKFAGVLNRNGSQKYEWAG